jgi:ATP-dependent protease La (LON) substrate-binding domain
MSKARVPIIGISHRVILPAATHRITISNLPERKVYIVSRGKKLNMFGVVTYKDPDKKIMYSYGTLVGVVGEMPIVRPEKIFSDFFNGGLANFSRNEWQLVILGVERFKILSISEDSGITYASIQVEKDTDTKITDKQIEDLRTSGKNYLRSLNVSPPFIIE